MAEVKADNEQIKVQIVDAINKDTPKKLISEMISTEQNFAKGIGNLNQYFESYLAENALLPQPEQVMIKKWISLASELKTCSQSMTEAFEKFQAESQKGKSSEKEIAEAQQTIVENLENYFKSASFFTSNYSHILSYVTQANDSSKKNNSLKSFETIQEEANKEQGNQLPDIQSLLITPAQRSPRFVMLFNELSKQVSKLVVKEEPKNQSIREEVEQITNSFFEPMVKASKTLADNVNSNINDNKYPIHALELILPATGQSKAALQELETDLNQSMLKFEVKFNNEQLKITPTDKSPTEIYDIEQLKGILDSYEINSQHIEIKANKAWSKHYKKQHSDVNSNKAYIEIGKVFDINEQYLEEHLQASGMAKEKRSMQRRFLFGASTAVLLAVGVGLVFTGVLAIPGITLTLASVASAVGVGIPAIAAIGATIATGFVAIFTTAYRNSIKRFKPNNNADNQQGFLSNNKAALASVALGIMAAAVIGAAIAFPPLGAAIISGVGLAAGTIGMPAVAAIAAAILAAIIVTPIASLFSRNNTKGKKDAGKIQSDTPEIEASYSKIAKSEIGESMEATVRSEAEIKNNEVEAKASSKQANGPNNESKVSPAKKENESKTGSNEKAAEKIIEIEEASDEGPRPGTSLH